MLLSLWHFLSLLFICSHSQPLIYHFLSMTPLYTHSHCPCLLLSIPKGCTTDKNTQGILHIKADPSTPLQFHLIKRWLLQLQWVVLEAYHLVDKREGYICMRWKSTLYFFLAKMNVYSVTAPEQRRHQGTPLRLNTERMINRIKEKGSSVG